MKLIESDDVIYKRSKNELYILRAAEDTRYNAWHWFRYLRKIISHDGKVLLSEESIDKLLNNPRLTNFQKVTLKRAVKIGTPTYDYIRGLNQPCKRKNLKAFYRKNPDAKTLRIY